MMSRKTGDRLSAKEKEKLEKYIKAFIAKVPQAIVQSRCGEKRMNSSCSTIEKDMFEIAIEDNPDIYSKVKEACSNINLLQEFSLCVETLLKTAEGDTLVLEAWNLCLTPSITFWDPKLRVYAEFEIVIRSLIMLLKSIVAVTRVTPAFKLSLGQSATTYVILYRIYPGELQLQQLGRNYQNNKIGTVHTPFGSLCASVAYRSKHEMTISSQNTGKENSFMVKSDYFNLDMSPKKASSAARIIKNRILHNSTNEQNVGAFAAQNSPDPSLPDLDFLQKNILHPSRCCLNHNQEKPIDDNANVDINSNLSASPAGNEREGFSERLSCSDVSDGSDFVLVDYKPSFATCELDNDLNTFYKECQSAPTLSSFSNQPSLQEQVQDVTSQLEKFEISMMDFDNFVDSVCQGEGEG
ncbi:hypothetical protein JTE90_005548 [Oedothorax gibbosus]|uniref:Autophagy-related protein 13 n=1 Tax=Oedothorax gibbosus TaxID=931172 RepID=A0AAV6VBE2_9ARAC|nr:hypothetical protein JTE90_005548 [Oedothorax gibbosus]